MQTQQEGLQEEELLLKRLTSKQSIYQQLNWQKVKQKKLETVLMVNVK